jgi:hypothetical protein
MIGARYQRRFEYTALFAALFCLGTALVQFSRFELFQEAPEGFLSLPASAPNVPQKLLGRLEVPRLALSLLILEVIVILRFGRWLGFAPGDDIVIRSGHDLHYRVNRMRVVNPDNISVLTGDNRTRLTLITCYPFRYIGSAPERFIVEAELVR